MTKQEVREHYVDSCCMCTSTNCYDCEIPIVIECIEKLIPEKPIYKVHSDFGIYVYAHCPNCDDDFHGNEYDEMYCHNCGQAILWESDNDDD